MSFAPPVGGVYDHYRQQVELNPGIYAPSGSHVMTDDFYTNAVRSNTPLNPTRQLNDAYGAQQTVDDWNPGQLKQNMKQV